MLEEPQEKERREIARGTRQHIVLELTEDLAVGPAEVLGKLVRGLPMAPLERLRLGEPARVVHK